MQKIVPIPIISRAVSSSPPASLDWKGPDPNDAIDDLNEQYCDDFKEINSVAALAYIICCSEWLYYFFHDHLEPAEAANFEQYIIANWVWVCDLPRKLPPYYDLTVVKESRGRPVSIVTVEIALDSIWEGILCIPREETYIESAVVTQLCEYMLPRDCGFKQWRGAILERLRGIFPSGEKHHDLVRISRRFFDTDVDLDDIDHEADCASLLGDGDFEGNRYLPLTEPEPD